MPETLNEQLELAGVYANALFELSREADRADEVRAQLKELAQLHESDPGFAALMESPAIDADKRAATLEKVLRGRLDDDALNTLLVMNRHGRSRLLAALARSFVLRCEEAQNQVEARVTSAVELDKRQRRVVEETTREITGKAPIVQYRVDPQVIGGLILQVGDVRYDNSVRQQLDTMRDELFERAERGLQVAVAD